MSEPLHRALYNQWAREPEPKRSWESYALKQYEAWELPLLEKGRKFMDAEENFRYSDSEEAIIHGRFPHLSGRKKTTFSRSLP